jgi:hypothetical protein
LLENVVVESFHQIFLIFSGLAGLGVDKKVASVLQVDDKMLFTSSLGPPQEIVDLVLLGDVVCLRVGVLSRSEAVIPWSSFTHLVYVVRVHAITTLVGSLQDPPLHDFLDMLLALLVVYVNIPLVTFPQSILQRFGSGTHAILVGRNSLPTIAFRVKRELVASIVEAVSRLALTQSKLDSPSRFPCSGRDVADNFLSLLVIVGTETDQHIGFTASVPPDLHQFL